MTNVPSSAPQLDGAGRGPKLPWLVGVGLVIVVGVFVAHAMSFWAYTNDDAYITFRYSRLMALGQGPYFNPGEHVEGYTNFLLMLLLVPVYWIGGEAAVPLTAKLLGVASGVGSVLLAWALTRSLLQPNDRLKRYASLIGVGAAGLVAVCPQYAINTTSGLETALFGFLLILSIYLWRAELYGRRRWAARIAWSLLILCRPEGSLLFAVCWFGQVYATWRGRREPPPPSQGGRQRDTASGRWWWPLILDGVIVTGVFGVHLAFRWLAYDGEWLPNTYYAKAGGYWKFDAWPYIRTGLVTPFYHEIGAGIGVLVALLWSWRMPSMLVLWLATLAGAFSPFLTGTDWMLGFRLIVPYLPGLACVVVVGWSLVVGGVLRRWALLVPVAVLVCTVLLAFQQRMAHGIMHDIIVLRSRGYETGHRQVARWLKERAGSGDRIALMDIGIIGYYCIDQYIIDITGLTDKFIARSEGQFLSKRYDPEYLLDRNPRFVVLAMTGPGTSYTTPRSDQRFRLWTIMEHDLFRHPEFRRRYIQPQSPPPWDEDWKAALATRFGAKKIFEHGHPGHYYLLAVFEAK